MNNNNKKDAGYRLDVVFECADAIGEGDPFAVDPFPCSGTTGRPYQALGGFQSNARIDGIA